MSHNISGDPYFVWSLRSLVGSSRTQCVGRLRYSKVLKNDECTETDLLFLLFLPFLDTFDLVKRVILLD